MECNKEEAVRAKEIAEKRMQNKDFAGAHKLAIKAQKLYPGLENISQMLTACEVHISAGLNVVGSEMDWYAILQVPHTVDELSLKKQYRKLALVLHPDKNKFPGAEAAFKLIGEANGVLSDKAKRSLYDIKRRTMETITMKKQPPQTNKSSYSNKQPGRTDHMRQTFWTSCPSCLTRYQHYMSLLNKAILCQSCLRPFYAYELNAQVQGGSSGANSGCAWNDSASPQHKDVSNNDAYQTGQKSTAGQKFEEMNRGVQTGKSSGNVGQKRGREAAEEAVKDVEGEKREMESSPIKKKNRESSKDTESLDPISYPEPEFHDFDKDRLQDNFKVDQLWAVYDDMDGMPRWYARIRKVYSGGSRLRISWLEADPKDQDGRNWLDEKLPVACGNFRNGQAQDTEDLRMFSHLASWEKGNSRCTCKIYPRKGDVWALFKDWNIQWSTSPDAHRKYEFEFVEILCDFSGGTGVEVASLVMLEGFTSLFQRMENMEKNPFQIPPSELLRFSHRVPCYRMTGEERQGVPAGSFELDPASVFTEGFLPAKSADKVFDKSVGVESDTKCHKPGNEDETHVAGSKMLNTAKESTSQNEKVSQNGGNLEKGSCSESVIQNKENLDNVSSTKCGTEKETPVTGPDVLNASKKSTSSNEKKIWNEEDLVDRRCSPQKMFGSHEKKPRQADPNQHPVQEEMSLHGGPDGLDDMPDDKPGDIISTKSHVDGKDNLFAGKVPRDDATEENCFPDPVFYSFVSERLEDKFQRGQIWAVYSTVDCGLPKYYARIKKVESPKFRVHATWLEACPESEKEIWWSKKELPVTCGKFMLQRETIFFEEASTFSHKVRHTSLKARYLIRPKKGEVWAMYKNWSSEWSFKDLQCCEYELVEVLNDSHLAIEVLVLEVVNDYKTIYRGGAKMDIPQDELLRFSHLVPSFRLTKEGGGTLTGCLEIDSLALPDSFFSKKLK